MSPKKIMLWFVALLECFVARANAVEVDYTRDVKPILKARCFACHGALKQEAGLRLDTGRLIQKGGDGGVAAIPGEPDDSRLIARISAQHASERMPPEGEPLSVTQVEQMRKWIAEGAKTPEGEEPEADPRQHWAFLAPKRPAVPFSEGEHPQQHPIDAFLCAELLRHKVMPRPLAPKSVLLRRVYLDLIGLPPTRAELRAFLADTAEDAYEKVVDRLLADPRHGERWGRHWMDVWRYSDWYGRRDQNDVRNSASQIFRWRDWIVQSLNSGKGYDRMVQEMLAADEICPEDYEAGVATGYVIRNYYSLNANDWMRSAVEHTGKAFLGLTFNCAHCHDHKYDPIEHDDYFRLRAFFEPIYIRQDRVPGEADPGPFEEYSYGGSRKVQKLGAVRVYDKQPDAPTWFYSGGDERNQAKERGSIAPGVPAFLQNSSLSLAIEPVKLSPKAWYPGLRPEIQQTMLAEAQAAIIQADDQLAKAKLSAGEIPASVRTALEQAEVAYEQAAERAKRGGRPGALVGSQSLMLDATSGRRIVQNGVQSLKTVDEGMTLEFQLLITSDKHVNFQFIKDNIQGHTAGYVAWEEGRITVYQAGTASHVVELGKYNFAAGQTRFHVSLVIQPTAAQCLLSIRSMSDNELLVDKAPIALNGWTPIEATKSIAFDARPGSRVVIDEIVFSAPPTAAATMQQVLAFDFESPTYPEGGDIAGIDGWSVMSLSVAPATSVLSGTAGNPELHELAEKLKRSQRAAREPRLKIEAAEAQGVAARAELAALEARIAAEMARLGEAPGGNATVLIRSASRREREAAVKKSESDLLTSEVAMFDAEAKPADDATRAAAVDVAAKSLSAAQAAINTARSALGDDKLAEMCSPLSPQFPQESTGRRRALALWITSRDNPLAARVAVNHIWSRHFHSPLVSSVYDFGRNGALPTHPQLLDWLAVEFMESDWSMKHLHRLIVTSDAYRRTSAIGDAMTNVAIDSENKLLWRMNTGRMESEVVRDSLLYCADRLDLKMGGVELENKDALTTVRRSLYYSVHPEGGGKSALGELFDAPDPLDCYRRTSSILPQQALALTNSDMVHVTSTAMVRSWQDSQGLAPSTADADNAQFIVAMFEQTLGHTPTEVEHRACQTILERQQQLAASPTSTEAITQARESLVRILLNHNDFLTIR